MGIRVEAAAYNAIGGGRTMRTIFTSMAYSSSAKQMDRGGKVSVQNAQPVQVYAVFDGMGGGEFGEQASFCAAQKLCEYQLSSEHIDNAENIRNFLTETSKEIDKISTDNNLRSGACGSTAAMLVVGDWCIALRMWAIAACIFCGMANFAPLQRTNPRYSAWWMPGASRRKRPGRTRAKT